jgi:hypothetical protein
MILIVSTKTGYDVEWVPVNSVKKREKIDS